MMKKNQMKRLRKQNLNQKKQKKKYIKKILITFENENEDKN